MRRTAAYSQKQSIDDLTRSAAFRPKRTLDASVIQAHSRTEASLVPRWSLSSWPNRISLPARSASVSEVCVEVISGGTGILSINT